MGRIEAIYDYTTPTGEPRIRKVRREGKRFKMQSAYRQPSGGWGFITGIADERLLWSARALYRLPEVIGAFKQRRDVWWAEGEKDADALALMGVTSTSTWQGASGLYWNQVEWFARAGCRSAIRVVVDNDLPGGWFGWERYCRLVKLGIDPSRVTVLAPPVGFKDAAEAFEAGRSLSALRRVDLGLLRRAADAYGADRARDYGRRGR